MIKRHLSGMAWLVALSIIFAGCAFAQGPSYSDTPPPAASAPAPPRSDAEREESNRAFVCEAAVARILLMKMSRLAALRSNSNRVRQFAFSTVDDDSRANRKLKEIAWSRDLEVCEEMDHKRATLLLHLQRYAGIEFDREYLTLQVDQRRRTVRLFQEQAQTGSDDELRNWAQSALPALETHLRTASLLADSR